MHKSTRSYLLVWCFLLDIYSLIIYGVYPLEDKLLAIERILSSYNFKILDGEYGLDYQIVLNGETYDLYVCIEENIVFTNHKKLYYIRDVQVKDWENRHVIVCHYNKSDTKIYYFMNSIRECENGKMLSYYIFDDVYLS